MNIFSRFLNKIKSYWQFTDKINEANNKINNLQNIISVGFQEQKILIANLYNKLHTPKDINDAEFKVFSQWGDDGIIQYLINNIDINKKIFVEFGVENYTEANTRFLLINNNWSGLIMDGSTQHMEFVKKDTIYWRNNLIAKTAFIDAENINGLISEENIKGEIGILHIDIDGNDYWVWKSINIINPIIVIVEYNSAFGIENAITIPYNAKFLRGEAHFSNLYYGSSLLSLCDLAEEKGYAFVGCNLAGNNAYFVRKDKLNFPIQATSPEQGYVESKFREGRDEKGNLTFVSGKERLVILKGLQVYNTRSNTLEYL